MTDEAVARILKHAAKEVGVSPSVRVSPHTCRHTFAQMQLKNGLDLYSVSRLMGHVNIMITQRYLLGIKDTTETVEVRGIKTVRLKFDSTSDWKDEDFCREKPDNKGQKYAEVQRLILSMLNTAPGNCMVSKELQRLVQEKTGCSESTYNHARSGLSGEDLIKNVRQIVPEVGVCGVTALTRSTAVA